MKILLYFLVIKCCVAVWPWNSNPKTVVNYITVTAPPVTIHHTDTKNITETTTKEVFRTAIQILERTKISKSTITQSTTLREVTTQTKISMETTLLREHYTYTSTQSVTKTSIIHNTVVKTSTFTSCQQFWHDLQSLNPSTTTLVTSLIAPVFPINQMQPHPMDRTNHFMERATPYVNEDEYFDDENRNERSINRPKRYSRNRRIRNLN